MPSLLTCFYNKKWDTQVCTSYAYLMFHDKFGGFAC